MVYRRVIYLLIVFTVAPNIFEENNYIVYPAPLQVLKHRTYISAGAICTGEGGRARSMIRKAGIRIRIVSLPFLYMPGCRQ